MTVKSEEIVNTKNSFDRIQRRIFTNCDSFGSHREPSSHWDMDCLQLGWLLEVNKSLQMLLRLYAPWYRFMARRD